MAKISRHRAKVLERQARAAERMITLPERFEKVPIISWYPGHMLKAQREMKDKLKIVDVVIELVDARIPYTSLNPQFDPIFQNKPRIVLLNKSLLSESSETKKWIDYYRKQGRTVLAIDAVKKRNMDKVLPLIRRAMSKLKSKEFRLSTRCMIIGIPNVGKSTFINRMASKNIAKTGAKPGLTRSQQWVKLADDVELLDTPGVLFPRIQTKADELNLSLTAGIRDELVGEQLTAEYLIYRLREQGIIDRLKGLTDENTAGLREEEVLRKFARIRGFIEIGDQEDMHKASVTLLNMFRESKVGALSLNHVDEMLEMERFMAEKKAKKELERLEDLAIKAEFKRKKEEAAKELAALEELAIKAESIRKQEEQEEQHEQN